MILHIHLCCCCHPPQASGVSTGVKNQGERGETLAHGEALMRGESKGFALPLPRMQRQSMQSPRRAFGSLHGPRGTYNCPSLPIPCFLFFMFFSFLESVVRATEQI